MGKNMMGIKIDNKIIGNDQPTFIIAEIGSNHNGDLKLAKKLIDIAKKSGADCAKFQTYTAENFCADKKKTFTFFSQGKKTTQSEYELFKSLEFSKKEWRILIEYCKKKKIIFMTTIQDPENLDMMKSLGLSSIKVGSDDFDHIDNLKIYCKSKLPIILSKGMTTKKELSNTIKVMNKYSKQDLAIMHCVSVYPCPPDLLNLKHISFLKKKYKNIIWGFSDHSDSTVAPAIAVSLGAKIIEKHITIDKNLPGPDHWFSLNPSELKAMVSNIRYAENSLGDGELVISKKEAKSKNIMRRRIVAKKDLKKNQLITKSNINYKRASSGEFLSNLKKIVGKKLNKNIKKNSGINIVDIIK